MDRVIGWFESHKGLLQAWAEAAIEDPSLFGRSHVLFEAVFDAMPFVRSTWPESTEQQARLRLHLFTLQLEPLPELRGDRGVGASPGRAYRRSGRSLVKRLLPAPVRKAAWVTSALTLRPVPSRVARPSADVIGLDGGSRVSAVGCGAVDRRSPPLFPA